jgi:hypothetical protein
MAVPDAMDEIELGFECARRDTGLAMPLSRLSFGGEVNSLSLPVAMLDAAMPPSDARSNLKDLSTQIARKRRAEPARDRLAAMIFARMSQGEINQDELASEIGMSSRTMAPAGRGPTDLPATARRMPDAAGDAGIPHPSRMLDRAGRAAAGLRASLSDAVEVQHGGDGIVEQHDRLASDQPAIAFAPQLVPVVPEKVCVRPDRLSNRLTAKFDATCALASSASPA